MKKTGILALITLIVSGISSCEKTKEKVNEATQFDMNYSTQITIPSSSLTAAVGAPSATTVPVDFETPETLTGSSGRFRSESTTKDLIEEIKITKFVISNPEGNLNYLHSFSIYLKTKDLGEVLVATKSEIPQGVSSVEADLKDVNIKEYIFKEQIQFRVKATLLTDTDVSGDQIFRTEQTVHVKGKRI